MKKNSLKESILIQFVARDEGCSNAMPVYVNGIRYRSIFEAGIDSELSFPTISIRLKHSNGAPCISKRGIQIVSEQWLENHPEYLLGEEKDGGCSGENRAADDKRPARENDR